MRKSTFPDAQMETLMTKRNQDFSSTHEYQKLHDEGSAEKIKKD